MIFSENRSPLLGIMLQERPSALSCRDPDLASGDVPVEVTEIDLRRYVGLDIEVPGTAGIVLEIFPDGIGAVVVLEDEIGLAITVHVTRGGDVPGRAIGVGADNGVLGLDLQS